MSAFKKYKCKLCGHIYDEEKGDAGTHIAPGTLWEDIPDDWECPECGAVKAMFVMIR